MSWTPEIAPNSLAITSTQRKRLKKHILPLYAKTSNGNLVVGEDVYEFDQENQVWLDDPVSLPAPTSHGKLIAVIQYTGTLDSQRFTSIYVGVDWGIIYPGSTAGILWIPVSVSTLAINPGTGQPFDPLEYTWNPLAVDITGGYF